MARKSPFTYGKLWGDFAITVNEKGKRKTIVPDFKKLFSSVKRKGY